MPQLVVDGEVPDFLWWDPQSPLPDGMSPLDAEIGKRIMSAAGQSSSR